MFTLLTALSLAAAVPVDQVQQNPAVTDPGTTAPVDDSGSSSNNNGTTSDGGGGGGGNANGKPVAPTRGTAGNGGLGTAAIASMAAGGAVLVAAAIAFQRRKPGSDSADADTNVDSSAVAPADDAL